MRYSIPFVKDDGDVKLDNIITYVELLVSFVFKLNITINTSDYKIICVMTWYWKNWNHVFGPNPGIILAPLQMSPKPWQSCWILGCSLSHWFPSPENLDSREMLWMMTGYNSINVVAYTLIRFLGVISFMTNNLVLINRQYLNLSIAIMHMHNHSCLVDSFIFLHHASKLSISSSHWGITSPAHLCSAPYYYFYTLILLPMASK